jgi:hypothetical protein
MIMKRDTKIFKTICTICIISLLHMGLFSLTSCNEKPTSSSDENEIECAEGLVGPQGGSLEVTDPESPYYGVKIIIPEGSLQYCNSLYFNEYYNWQYAGTGFMPQTDKPFNFNMGIFFDGDSVQFRISFPIKNIKITDSTSQILCAYHYDPALPCYLKWHIVIPTEINDSTMIIDTDRFYGTWSWGLVSLYDVDYECYLEPLMYDIMGQEKWNEVLNQIASTIDTTILADDVSFDCISMLMIRGVFESLYLALGEQMDMYQTLISPIAGDCNVLNPLEFFKGAIEYLGLLALSALVSIASNIADGGILSSFFPKFMDKAVESSSCNYAAFYQWTDEQFWGFFSLYCFYYLMIHLIDWIVLDTDIINCPNWTPTTIEWD